MKQEKTLPISENPPLRDINILAFPMSVLDADPALTKSWILQKFPYFAYIKLLTGQTLLTNHVNNFRVVILWRCFKKKLILYFSKKNIIKSLKKAIDKEYYIFVGNLNERFIPERSAYKYHYDFYHDILIYGYDDKNNTFKTLGYDINGEYSGTYVSQQDIASAIKGCKKRYLPTTIAFQINKNYNFHRFSTRRLKKDYQKSINRKNKKIGMNAYDIFLKELICKFENEDTLDLRCFRAIYEHLTVMAYVKERISLDQNIKELLQKNKELAEITFKLAIKYNVVKKTFLSEKILSNIKKIKNNEEIIILDIINKSI